MPFFLRVPYTPRLRTESPGDKLVASLTHTPEHRGLRDILLRQPDCSPDRPFEGRRISTVAEEQTDLDWVENLEVGQDYSLETASAYDIVRLPMPIAL